MSEILREVYSCTHSACHALMSDIIHLLPLPKKKKKMFSVMFSTLVHHFQLLKQLMRSKHLKSVAVEESIHTLHSSLNV